MKEPKKRYWTSETRKRGAWWLQDSQIFYFIYVTAEKCIVYVDLYLYNLSIQIIICTHLHSVRVLIIFLKTWPHVTFWCILLLLLSNKMEFNFMYQKLTPSFDNFSKHLIWMLTFGKPVGNLDIIVGVVQCLVQSEF